VKKERKLLKFAKITNKRYEKENFQKSIHVDGTNFTKIEQQLNISSLRRLISFPNNI